MFGGEDTFSGLGDIADLDGSNGFVIGGASIFDRIGSSLGSAGDFNGDGLTDLLVGAPDANGLSDRSDAGEVYVVFGTDRPVTPGLGLAAIDGENGRRFFGSEDGDKLGVGLLGIGDHNGDGIDDVAIVSELDTSQRSAFKVISVVFGASEFAPEATDDFIYAVEDIALEVDLFGINGIGKDQDDDRSRLSIVAINGLLVDEGDEVPLSDGGIVTIGSGGIVEYLNRNPIGVNGSGGIKRSEFSYTISDGINTDIAIVKVQVLGRAEKIRGTAGADRIYGTKFADFISALEGDDTITANEEDDTVLGGEGDDRLSGGDGYDKLMGDGGDDTVFGGADNDTIFGGQGADHIFGGGGVDTIWADSRDEVIDGGSASDILFLNLA